MRTIDDGLARFRRVRPGWGPTAPLLRRMLITGLLVTMPLAVTYLLLRWLFATLDGLLQPLARAFIGATIPGLGLVVGLVLILFIGAVASNVVGRRLLTLVDRLMLRIPLARPVYSATKQISDALLGDQRSTFRRVVLVEWPRHGAHTVGFVTGEDRAEDGTALVSVFIISAPNPTTGFLMLVPESEVVPTNLSVEDGMKLVLSGGIAGTLAEISRALIVRHRPQGASPHLPG
ncbi:MAG: DUF502 domain-containing protein [Armatimonadota bacterium]|nr:DUF502 domain-containing protein [Armatimonadota bacterium]MDR7451013.1 DUF502 domain-containing protein [Armatimonadota bacterium]MDR7465966.1 DUF502 domain-containing protein [Armatimonadota bacterium]MDR7494031.1 DUF502 domain-containing protein [Armatimonadota bacterium]MDR7498481.1 DUF502 domain-containing protein [Armatimonadota bacterium]